MLKQKPNVITGKISDFRGRFCETSEILVRDVQPSEVDKTLKSIEKICWLLSFAGLSRVVYYRHDYPDDGFNQSQHAAIGTAEFFRPTINIQDGALVKSFVEQTYPNFERLEENRKINVAIDYMLQAERHEQPTECRLILAFVLLENLKYTFARSKSIPYINGYFRKTPNSKGEKYSFKELMDLMLKDVGITRDLSAIIDLRNEIIHSGLSQKSQHDQWKIYEKTHDLLREYILKLLGYHGSYLTYVSASNLQAVL